MSKVNPKPEAWIAEELVDRRARHLERRLTTYEGMGGSFQTTEGRWLNFASNDYLDLARHLHLKDAAARAVFEYGVGATASRLVTGTLPLHTQLEAKLAAHKGYPAVLVFGSGYLTNAGVIPALVGRNDHVFADRFIHASMIDAVQLSGATLHRFAHNAPDALNEQLKRHTDGKRLVLTESVYSMDGDCAPLAELAEVVRHHQVMWMVDEAHAGGIYGPNGAGRVAELNLQTTVTIAMGTLSKAYGGYGGYVACSIPMRDWLINNARAFIYTTAPPPPVIGAAIAALDVVQCGEACGATLLRRAAAFRARLNEHGLDTLQSASQIVPVMVGDNEAVMRIAERLNQQRIIVGAMRPPTVPPGGARLRCSVTLSHSDDDLSETADTIYDAFRKEGLR